MVHGGDVCSAGDIATLMYVSSCPLAGRRSISAAAHVADAAELGGEVQPSADVSSR